MSNETSSENTKRRGGWPAGKPRGRKVPQADPVMATEAMPRAAVQKSPLLSRMKARPNWDGDDFVGVGIEGADRLKIPQDVVDSLWRDGIALQWVTKSVRGMETPQELSKMTKGGWTPVHQSDFDGALDGMFMSKGIDEPIVVEDCLLVARPAELQKKARVAERREAGRPLQIKEEELGHGIPGVTGSNHKSVSNSIKKTLERVEIPE